MGILALLAPVGMTPLIGPVLLISTKLHHLVHLCDASNHAGVVAISLSFTRCALKPPETLEQQIPLIDVLMIKRLYPVSMGLSHYVTGSAA
ncbi:hypothetical protein [Synechococcus sp. MU1655]|uniref:hypothetical protein n=1 Tax=Synechococcus sp. MU1655 TaxID=2508355 RepID=UPI0020262CF5|nr:hypothetical protein [Synechococcus sp. MU1655]